jgi:hypothetical protein
MPLEQEFVDTLQAVAERSALNDRALLDLVKALIDKVVTLEIQIEVLKVRMDRRDA